METGLRRGSLHSPSRQRFRARAFGPRTPAGGWLAATQSAAPFGDLTIQPPCSGDAFAELKREALATAPRRRVYPRISCRHCPIRPDPTRSGHPGRSSHEPASGGRPVADASFLVKLVATPLLISFVYLVERRFGHAVAGLVFGFPLTSALATSFLAAEQ